MTKATKDYVPADKREGPKEGTRFVGFRLEAKKKDRMERKMRADGIGSLQALGEAMVDRYLEERGRA